MTVGTEDSDMAATKKARIVLTVHEEFCKGCGLCVDVCPQHAMRLQERIDSRGFHLAHLAEPDKCTGCAQCFAMCPDACIRIVQVTEDD